MFVWSASAALLALVIVLPWSNGFDATPGLPHKDGWSQPAKDAFNALSRPAFAVGLSGLAHLCLDGYGGVVNEWLGSAAWEVLAKLSYGAYLWHLVILFFYVATSRVYPGFSRLNTTVTYLGVLVLAFLASLVSYLVCEQPAANLEVLLMKKLIPKPKARGVEPLLAPRDDGAAGNSVPGKLVNAAVLRVAQP